MLISASVGGLLLLPARLPQVPHLRHDRLGHVPGGAPLDHGAAPAILGMLGPNVDALNVRTLLRVPFLRDWPLSNRIINWLGDRTQKTKTSEEIENGFWAGWPTA